MTSENTALAIDLTQAILEQFWQQDTSLLLKYIDEDFSLTDALNHSIIQGQQQVCSFIPTAISGIIKSRLTDKMSLLRRTAAARALSSESTRSLPSSILTTWCT